MYPPGLKVKLAPPPTLGWILSTLFGKLNCGVPVVTIGGAATLKLPGSVSVSVVPAPVAVAVAVSLWPSVVLGVNVTASDSLLLPGVRLAMLVLPENVKVMLLSAVSDRDASVTFTLVSFTLPVFSTTTLTSTASPDKAVGEPMWSMPAEIPDAALILLIVSSATSLVKYQFVPPSTETS